VIYPKSIPGIVVEGICIEYNDKEKAELSADERYELIQARLNNAPLNGGFSFWYSLDWY